LLLAPTDLVLEDTVTFPGLDFTACLLVVMTLVPHWFRLGSLLLYPDCQQKKNPGSSHLARECTGFMPLNRLSC
jgi:hypothetical protein